MNDPNYPRYCSRARSNRGKSKAAGPESHRAQVNGLFRSPRVKTPAQSAAPSSPRNEHDEENDHFLTSREIANGRPSERASERARSADEIITSVTLRRLFSEIRKL